MFATEPLSRRLGGGVCALALAWAGALAAPPVVTKPVEVGATLPDVVMAGLNGTDRRLSSYRGQRLIINVWASWCPPCRAEAASLERLAWGEFGSKVVVIGVSTDDDRRAAAAWLRRSNATLNHYIDAALVLENMLGAAHIPLTVLVDAQGRVVARFPGAREWDTAESIRLIDRAYSDFARAPKK